MAGFDADKAHAAIGGDADVDVIAAVALGYRAPKDILEDKGLQEAEAPNARKAATAFAFKDRLAKVS